MAKFFGKYRGTVFNNVDPMQIGRLMVMVPDVSNVLPSTWAMPCVPFGGIQCGFLAIPPIGAGVWIEFEGGDLSYPVWTGTWYTSGAIPESAQPGKKVFKTKSGHKIVFDDDGGTLEVTDSNSNTVAMDANTIKIAAGNATTIVVDAPQIQLVNGASHALVFGDQLLQYLNQIVQIYQTHMHPGQSSPVGPVTPAPPTPPMPSPTPSLLSTKVTTG